METLKGSTAIENSQNSKIGLVSATYTSFASCPKTCMFYTTGACYAKLGLTGIHANRLTRSGITDIVELAHEEAKAINGLSGARDLRIHVSGDSTTDETVKIVADAAMNHMAKQGRVAWCYTHAITKRESWGSVSILRSCETLTQVKQAHDDNFASAMVVSEFESDKPYDIGEGFTGIPCRNQVNKEITCTNCKLCFKDKVLHKSKRVILFATHGACKKKANIELKVINDKN